MALAAARHLMRRAIRSLGLGLALLVLPGLAWAQAPLAEHQPGEVLIRFKAGTPAEQAQSVLTSLGATRITQYRTIGASHQRIARMSVEQAIARYRTDPRVQYIEPNYIVHATLTPNDPSYAMQWALNNLGQTGGTAGADIHAQQAWDVTTGSPSVLVAIIDSGIEYTHPDLAANIFHNPREIAGNKIDDDGNGFVDDLLGWDFVNHDNDPTDDNGHGTHVAGTVGAVGNNGVGVVGVCWNVKLLPVKFLNAQGAGNVADAISAIEYATMMGARIMSNSWGGGPYSQALYDAIKAAGDAGALFVAAAGNDGADNDLIPTYPAGYKLPNVISVAATDDNDRLANFSNFGALTVDLAAPGVDIYSTTRLGRYITLSGTSMATPHVSGALALILSRFPNIDPLAAKQLLLSHVDPVASLSGRVATGGRLDAFLPLASPDSVPPDPITDLSLTHADGQWADFQWTATGDDGRAGTAFRYDFRFSTTPITPANFSSATAAIGLPSPLAAGSIEHIRVNGLEYHTGYYFAVEAHDEFGNASSLSNEVTGTTLDPPVAAIESASLDADLFTGQKATRSLTVRNSGQSELSYQLSEQPQSVPIARAGRIILPAGPMVAGARAIRDKGAVVRYHAGRAGTLAPPVRLSASAAQAVPTIGYRALMITSGGELGPMRDLLAQFPDLVQVDMMDASLSTPTLDQLKAYQAVLVSNGTPFSDAIQFGNVLADYVDSGGGVILGLATFIQNWQIQGRFLTGGYIPFIVGSGPGPGSTLGAYDATHPIMDGVTTVTGDLLGVVTLSPGSQLVASWANGQPFVATKGAHVVGVNLYYDFTGYWTGDAPLVLHNAIRWAGGAARILSFDPASGVLAPGGAADVQVTLDASQLFGGHYASDVVLNSNDPVQPRLTLRANLNVTGAPDIAVSPPSLNFGQVFVGYSLAETVTISNRGTDVLNVTSVAVSAASVHASQSAFVLGPGGLDTLLVTYAPTVAGPLSGTLTLASDDPDTPMEALALSGTSLDPPVISASPPEMSANLLTGQTSSDVIDIENTGGSDLIFTLGWRSVIPNALAARPSPGALQLVTPVTHFGASPGGAGPAAIASRSPSATKAAPVRLAAPAATVASHDILVLATVDVSGTIVSALQQLGRGFDLVTTDDFTQIDFSPYRTVIVGMDGGLIDEADCHALANAATAGRLLFMMGGSNYPPYYLGLQQFLLSQTGQQGWVASAYPHLIVVAPNDPLAAGLPASTSFIDFAASYYSVRINDPKAPPVVINGDHQPVLVHRTLGAGTLVYFTGPPDTWYWEAPSDSTLFRKILANGLQFEAPQWLAASPRSGTVPAGGRQSVDVSFDATRLNGGAYEAKVVINSNAPDQPITEIAAHLHVTGIPRIALSAPSLDFGQLFLTVSKTETLQVSNPGTDVLTLSSATAQPADYAVSAGWTSLNPGDSRPLLVTFSPLSAATIPGTLKLNCNDPDHAVVTVPLSGEGLPPPVLGPMPASLSFTVATGVPASQLMEIQNSGGSPLSYQIAIQAAPGTAAVPARAISLPTVFPASKRLPAPDAASSPMLKVARLASGDRMPPLGTGARSATLASREPLTLAIRRTVAPGAARTAATVLVIPDGGTEADVASVLTGAGYSVTLGPDDGAWDGTNPAPDGFAAVVLLDGPNFGSDMPMGGQNALLHYVSNGGGLVVTEWITFEVEQGRYTTLAPLLPMTRLTGNSGSFLYHVIKTHPVTAGVTSHFTVESGVTGGFANSGSALVTLSDDEAVVVASDYALGHVVQFGMAGNWNGYRPLAQPDMQRLLVNAADWMSAASWLLAEPAAGTVPPGSSQQVVLTADPGRLLGGDYGIQLALTTNDPAHPLTTIPASLHVSGAPRVAVSPAALPFGSVYMTTTRSETLLVTNQGTDLLTVSAVGITGPPYATATGGFALAPGRSQQLVVVFTPQGAGELDGSLEIHSDDPDRPVVTVALTGVGVAPPQIQLTPAALSADLLSGQPASQTLHVGNSGGSELTFSVRPAASVPSGLQVTQTPVKGAADVRRGRPVSTAAGGPDSFGYRWKDSGDPNGPQFNWVEISQVGIVVPLTGDDWNFGSVPIGFNFPFYGTNFSTIQICSNGWISFTSLVPQFLNQPLPSPYAPENLVAAFWADLSTTAGAVYHYYDGTRLIVEYKNVRYSGASDLFTFELLLYPDGRIVYQYQSMGGALPNATVGIQNAARDDGLLIAFNTPYVRDQLAVSIAPGPAWLSVVPPDGTVAAGADQPLEVRFNPLGLAAGDYNGLLLVTSNDPANASQEVPVGLHVRGAPSLALAPASLAFGPLFLGLAQTETLMVSNAGSDLVNVSLIELQNSVFSAPTGAFSLSPGSSLVMPVTYTPTALGLADGSLTFHSNDSIHPTLSVPLHGEAVGPPIAFLAPDSLADVLGPSEVHTETLRLDNRGGSPLEWSARAFGLSQAASVLEAEAAGPLPRHWSADALHAARTAAHPASAGPGAADSAGAIPSLSDVLVLLNARYASVNAAIPNRFDFSEGVTGISIIDGGENMYETGNLLSTDLAGNIPYYDNAIYVGAAFGAQYFTRKFPGLFVLGADLAGPTRFSVSGSLGANGAGTADGSLLELEDGGTSYFGFVKRVYGAGVPSVNHLTILVNPGSLSHSISSDTHVDQETVGGLSSIRRFYYLLFAGEGGAYISNADMAVIMARFVSAITPAPPWLGISPTTGTVPPHGNQELTASFDSKPLGPGDYFGSIHLQTNDPAAPLLTVPVNISVVTYPTATDASLVSATSSGGRVQVVWQSASGPGLRATVQRATRSSGWSDLGPILPDGLGYLRFEDSDVVPGMLYGYRLAIADAGGPRTVGETWVTVPLAAPFALYGLQPNPAVRDLRVAFSLPDDQPATLELLDLAGRRVRFLSVGSHGAGRHVVSLGQTASMASGVYLVRLERGGRKFVSKCVVMQ